MAGLPPKDPKQFVREAQAKFPTLQVIGTYVNKKKKIEFGCSIHGNTWMASPFVVMQAKTACPICREEIAEAKRLTTQDIKERVALINPNIEIIGEYQDVSIPIECKCKICGCEWKATPNNLTGRKSGCPACSKHLPITEEMFLEWLRETNPDIELISEYRGLNGKGTFRCKKDGTVWKTGCNNIRAGTGCPECAKKIAAQKNSLGQETFNERMRIKHPNIKIEGIYENNSSLIKCECLICGYQWRARAQNLLGGYGCYECGNRRRTLGNIIPKEEIERRLSLVNPYVKIIGETKGIQSKAECECLICGHKWFPLLDNLIRQEQGCPACKMSRGERKIYRFLDENKINFNFQKRFDDCRDKRRLPFDFYLPDYNLCIEFDGKQHFEKTGFGAREEHAQKSFETVQRHDQLKTEYCKNKGIKLLRIHYKKIEETELLVKEELERIIFDNKVQKPI